MLILFASSKLSCLRRGVLAPGLPNRAPELLACVEVSSRRAVGRLHCAHHVGANSSNAHPLCALHGMRRKPPVQNIAQRLSGSRSELDLPGCLIVHQSERPHPHSWRARFNQKQGAPLAISGISLDACRDEIGRGLRRAENGRLTPFSTQPPLGATWQQPTGACRPSGSSCAQASTLLPEATSGSQRLHCSGDAASATAVAANTVASTGSSERAAPSSSMAGIRSSTLPPIPPLSRRSAGPRSPSRPVVPRFADRVLKGLSA